MKWVGGVDRSEEEGGAHGDKGSPDTNEEKRETLVTTQHDI